MKPKWAFRKAHSNIFTLFSSWSYSRLSLHELHVAHTAWARHYCHGWTDGQRSPRSWARSHKPLVTEDPLRLIYPTSHSTQRGSTSRLVFVMLERKNMYLCLDSTSVPVSFIFHFFFFFEQQSDLTTCRSEQAPVLFWKRIHATAMLPDRWESLERRNHYSYRMSVTGCASRYFAQD